MKRIAACALLLSCTVSLPAQDPARNTLRGIQGVKVVVEELGQDGKTAGLSVEQLRSDVETKLRIARIRVYDSDNETTAWLYLNVNVLQQIGGTFAYNVEISFSQYAILIKDLASALGSIDPKAKDPHLALVKHMALVTTWTKAYIGAVGSNKVDSIRDTVRDLTDQFINEYLAANPDL